jgi:hypothetical protein
MPNMQPETLAVVHTCPVCGNPHEVHPTLDRLSYGRQRTCSPRCKVRLPALVRARILADMEQRRAKTEARDYFTRYSQIRPRTALGDKTPDEFYRDHPPALPMAA